MAFQFRELSQEPTFTAYWNRLGISTQSHKACQLPNDLCDSISGSLGVKGVFVGSRGCGLGLKGSLVVPLRDLAKVWRQVWFQCYILDARPLI